MKRLRESKPIQNRIQFMLTDTEIRDFRENGFLAFEGLISGERLAWYTSIFDELVERGRSLTVSGKNWCLELDRNEKPIPGILHKIQGVCMEEPRVLELAREPAIVKRARCLVGDDFDVFGTKFFPKLPRLGTSTHWHQDNYYFGTNTDHILSCGIYLEESDCENGCLRVVPGSHLSGEIAEHVRVGQTHGSWTQVDESAALDLVVPGGTVVFFSANLLHGAYDNTSDRTRYSTAWHYIPGDVNPPKFKRGVYEDRHPVCSAATNHMLS